MINKSIISRSLLVCFNALLLVSLTLLGNSLSIDRNGTGSIMKQLDVVRQIYKDKISGKADVNQASMSQEFFPVNIGYDREMVPAVDDFGIPVGERPVVSRGRLAQFLSSIRDANYKSVIVDVQFFKSDSGEADSLLFATLNNMPRLLVSANGEEDAEDAILPNRLASSEYNVSLDEDNFVKYRYDHGDVQDMALSTYNLRNGFDVCLAGLFPNDHGRLAMGTLPLWMPYRIDGCYDADGEKTYYNLTADLLDVYSPDELAELVEGKTIVIGDFVGGDDHDTYTGSIAGPVILINAVIALEAGRHLINWWWMGIFFVIYVLLTLMLIYDPFSLLPAKWAQSKIVHLFVAGLSFGVVILGLNIVMYLFTGVMYDLYFPTLWLTVLYFIKENCESIKRQFGIVVKYIKSNFSKAKSMKNIIVAVVFSLMSVFAASADNFKILYLTTPNITIGGKVYQVGDTFSGNASIRWSAPRQAMKVQNTTTKKQSLVVAEKYTGIKSADMNSYFVQSKQLSTRQGELINTLELGIVLSDTYYLLDPIELKTTLPVDDKHFFFASYDHNGETINKKLNCKEGILTFDRSLYSIDGNPIEPFDVTLSVWYMDASAGKRTLVTDKMIIIPI